jgi:hypothetical protein
MRRIDLATGVFSNAGRRDATALLPIIAGHGFKVESRTRRGYVN